MNLNMLPNTGLPLPFVSYGGTALLTELAEVGLVLAVERKNCINAGGRQRVMGVH